MARLPTVAIVGRPNTGKSTLFNSLLKKHVAIVSDIPGTTRDHIASKVETPAMDFILLDTGGMGGGTEDKDFETDVHEQSLLALRHADLILFTVNAREELTGSDREIVATLRKGRRRHVPVILIATKCDNPDIAEAAELSLHELGIGDEVLTVSAISNVGTRDIRDAIVRHLKALHFEKIVTPPSDAVDDVVPEEEIVDAPDVRTVPRVAVVGKPNVGKSSLVNALMSDTQREASPRLVSDIPGTTRDTTDTTIRREDREYLFVDTAGLRKQARVEEELESIAVLRTIQAMEEADIVVLVLDASEAVSKQDKHIAGMAIDEGKGLIILLNKIDLLKGEERTEKTEAVRDAFPFCRYAPILPVSAISRENLPKVFNFIDMANRNLRRRLPLKELHTWLKDQLYGKPMGALMTAKHITQAKDIPPTFILFVKNPKEVQVSQLRFLDNRIRETFEFTGVPIRWVTKGPGDRMEK